MCRRRPLVGRIASSFFTRSSLLGLIYLTPLARISIPVSQFRKGEAKGGESVE